ncbi:type IIL restriction-modification enzyme MmeI [Corynebacterium sp. ES2730-CONJ]|uniref:type IIL restriction-modification enzyme MmeI n=1 Tax=Corynebacterium sp. ES2730-CONJ TaxID=2973941 RepID=UPI00286F4AF3|nr:type IIL restriction-modification enzyme MmeI [Corynebacterium sp. ES2730-CONJ]
MFRAPDEDGLLIALISSSMFITWQRTVGGRLESRLRFSTRLRGIPSPCLIWMRQQGSGLSTRARKF